MKYILGFVVTSVLFLITPPSIHATDYYVSTSGNDGNNGSLVNPFKTVQKGVNVATSPGDIIYVMPGEYRQTSGSTDSSLVEIIGKHGQPGNNIVLKAYAADNPPILMGYGHTIRIIGSSYYTVDGFNITDTYHAAITTGLADYITIQNNHIHFGFSGFCNGTETPPDPFTGCTVGAIKGRYYTTGTPIIEFDNIQNPGIHMCKTKNSQILNNYIENSDEAIYVGSAGNVVNEDCYYPQYNDGRLWTEGNVFAGNTIENPMDEAIELKSDTRNNSVHNNIIRSTRRNWGSTMIEIRGHINEVFENIVVGAPVVAIRTHSENPGDPGPDRVANYTFVRNGVTLYKSSYENYIHNNYVYSFSQSAASGYGIVDNDTSAANRVEHNTVVGINEFSGLISEYVSIKTQAIPSATVLNNLMVGIRRSSDANTNRYEYHLITSANLYPEVSDYNAYYPRLKTNNSSCVIGFGALAIVCQNNNPYNQSVGYEYHSIFMDSNPIKSDDNLCTKDQLLSIPKAQLSDRIQYCSAPVPGSVIIANASDGTNIGAYQNTATPNPTSTPTSSPAPTPKPGDANGDNMVNETDYSIWLAHYPQQVGGGASVGDFNGDGQVNGIDYTIWLVNYGR